MQIQKLKPSRPRGLVVVITGDGKGKTTSAMGMALRAVGHGMKVCVIQFMKGDLYSGEWDGVKHLQGLVELTATGKGFCGIMGNKVPFAEHRQSAQDALRLARARITGGEFGLMVLDEIHNALKLRLLDLEQVLDLLDQRPPLMHLVLTGRDAHPDVIERADTVSAIREIKHAYRQDIEPQPGVDY